jgi:hypothetical protein
MNRIFKLSNKKVEALKAICKESNCIWIDSSYGGKRFGFKVSDKWKKENKEVFTEDNIDRVYLESYFKMLSEFNPISDEFIKNNSLEYGHINAIRQSYYSYYMKGDLHGVSELEDNIDGVIMIDYKRPFGNSYVIGDVMCNFGIDNDEHDIDYEGLHGHLIDESINAVKSFFIEETFNPKLAIRSYGRLYWQMETFEQKESLLTKIKNYINEYF